jgi:hypothetical protein
MAKKTKKLKCGPKEGLVRKLDPSRLRVSNKFHAMLGCLLEQEWTTPLLTAMCITSDGHVLGEKEGDVGFNLYLGAEADLERNIRGVCRAVGASETETGYLFNLVARHRI